jgi:hypothetical protein
MKTQAKLLVMLIVFCCLTSWGQKPANKVKSNLQETTIKKQIIVDDLENQVRDISFAAVRVFVRYKLAAWLWKDGKDETGRADQLAVKAIDELYEKKTEIPSLYANTLKPDVFALLEVNAKDTAKKLREKYDFSSEDELVNAQSLLNKKDGEKLATEKILKSLSNQTELSSTTTFLIDQLQSRKSPELLRILTAILNLEETSKSNLSTDSLFLIVYCFRDSIVPNDLRLRFFKIVISKARNAVQFPDSNVQSAYRLLNSVMPDIPANAPNLLTEANALQSVLRARISQTESEAQEIFKRIEDSADKLSALISEAEKTEDEALKYRLLVMAAELALNEKKFRHAVDLAGETIDVKEPKAIANTFRRGWHDQFLGDVVQKTLKENDVDSVKYITKKIIDKLSRAEALRKTAIYYFEKQDLVSAIDAFDESLKLTTNADDDIKRMYVLFNLVSTAQKIDKNRISEVTVRTAKAIDAIPTLDIEDKPGTEKYNKYVADIMRTNWNLLPVINNLARENPNEAIDFVNRINKKEVKIIANLALSVASFNVEYKTDKVETKLK